jgi:hypothetical protein
MSDRPFRVYIQSGGLFNPLEPDVELITIDDIARGLANECRYNAQTDPFYSVAQHSIYISNHCSPENALCGLLHDASEAFLSDIPSPLKKRPEFAFYREAEARLQKMIYAKYGINEEPEEIKKLDIMIWNNEITELFKGQTPTHDNPIPGLTIDPWPPDLAYKCFLYRFNDLTHVR